MLKKILLLSLSLLTLISPVQGAPKNLLLQKPQHIFVNNTILSKVNGKPISVVDLMKKMDMVFYRQFPQYSSSTEARFQFYTMNWKHVLNEMIEKELILADAEEVKVEVSKGDIRQEMENMFGPNIIVNLNKAGLTYEDAWDLVKEDLLIKRMMMMRVNSKAVRNVTPQEIKIAYEDYAKENIKPDAWNYRVISFRGEDPTLCAETAKYTHQLLSKDKLPLEELSNKLQERPLVGETVFYNISEDYTRTDKEVSESYRDILASLEPDTFSQPLSQKSRNQDQHVYRIFHLISFIPGGAPSFSKVEVKLKNRLIDNNIEEESKKYLTKLRKHFNIEDHLPSEDFQPFVLN